MAKEENVYNDIYVTMTCKNQGFGAPQWRSKVTAERVALVVLSVLLLAAVAALTGITVAYCLDKKTTPVPGSTCPCDDGWELNGTKCYYFSPSSNRMNWNESRVMCQQRHGDLVKIETREEQVFLDAKLQTLMLNDTDMFWIGLTDSQSEGQCMWTAGSALNLSLVFWANDEKNLKEPDDWRELDPSGQDCVRMGHVHLSVQTGWYNDSCKMNLRSICENRARIC